MCCRDFWEKSGFPVKFWKSSSCIDVSERRCGLDTVRRRNTQSIEICCKLVTKKCGFSKEDCLVRNQATVAFALLHWFKSVSDSDFHSIHSHQ